MLALNPIEVYGRKVDVLGSGVTSKVKKYSTKEKSYAIKIYRGGIDSVGVNYESLREIAVLRKIKHKNIIKLIDIIPDNNPKLVMECGDWTLDKYMDSHEMTNETNKSYIRQLLKGLKCLHDNNIWHRDVKPKNIICFQDKRVCLADFGLAKSFSSKGRVFTQEVQSLYWRAPEILLGCDTYGPEIDIFSLGIIFAELYIGKNVFLADSEFNMLYKEVILLSNFSQEKWPDITEYPNYDPAIEKWSQTYKKDSWEDKFKLVGIIYPEHDVIDLIKGMTFPNPEYRMSLSKALQFITGKDLSKSIDNSTEPLCKKLNQVQENIFHFENLGEIYDKLFQFSYDGYSLRTFIYMNCLFESYLSRHIFYPELVKPSNFNLEFLIKACFIIAAKFIDIYILDLRSICENKDTLQHLIFYENQVLRALNYDLILSTPFTEIESLTENMINKWEIRRKSNILFIFYIFNSINQKEKLNYEELAKQTLSYIEGQNPKFSEKIYRVNDYKSLANLTRYD